MFHIVQTTSSFGLDDNPIRGAKHCLVNLNEQSEPTVLLLLGRGEPLCVRREGGGGLLGSI